MSDDNALVVRPQTAIEDTAQKKLLDVLGRYKKTIDALLPKIIEPKRFAYLAVSAIRQNPSLAGVSPASFLNCVILAGQLGIEIRRDSAYLVAFGSECTLLVDYKAKCSLARRGGKIAGIQGVLIRERDDFDWEYGVDGVRFHHRPFAKGIQSPEERGEIIGVYSFAQFSNGGGVQFREPLSLSEIDRTRRRSRAGVASMSIADIIKANEIDPATGNPAWMAWSYKDPRRKPWITDFSAMTLKTSLHSLFKVLPLDPAAELSQEVDSGFDTGKQPNILADAVDIDPVDEKPMIEASAEEQQKVLEEKLAAGREAAHQKKEDKKAAKAAKPVANAFEEFPEEVTPGRMIYVRNVLYRGSEDAIGWNKVEQSQ